MNAITESLKIMQKAVVRETKRYNQCPWPGCSEIYDPFEFDSEDDIICRGCGNKLHVRFISEEIGFKVS